MGWGWASKNFSFKFQSHFPHTGVLGFFLKPVLVLITASYFHLILHSFKCSMGFSAIFARQKLRQGVNLVSVITDCHY